MNTQNQKFQTLKQFPLLDSFTDAELGTLETILEYCSLRSGEIIFHEHDTSDEIYFIKTGALEICKAGQASDTVYVIVTLQEGEVCGELAFLDGYPGPHWRVQPERQNS